MDLEVVLAFLTLAGLVAAGVLHRRSCKENRILKKAAERLARAGSATIPNGRKRMIEGRYCGFAFTLSLDEYGRQVVCVDGRETIPLQLRLEGPKPEGLIDQVFHPPTVITGDDHFDDQVTASGDPIEVSATLDQETRDLIIEVVRQGGSVKDGFVTYTCLTWPGSITPFVLEESVKKTVTLAQKLALPEGPARHLADHALHEKGKKVRLHNLQLLVTHFPGNPITDQTIASLLSDRSTRMRLEAATLAGVAGHETLLQLVTDSAVMPTIAAEALSRLTPPRGTDRAPIVPVSIVTEVLEDAIAANKIELQKAAFTYLGRSRDAEALQTLKRIAAGVNPALASAALLALAESGLPSEEFALIAGLTHKDVAVVHAAIAGLSAIGSTAAIPRLRTVGQRFPEHPRIECDAVSALAAITARERAASAGGLTLVDETSGQLAIAQGVLDGRLALAEDTVITTHGGTRETDSPPAHKNEP